MSTEKQTSKFGLTRKVMAFFKITEDARVDSFFISLDKEWNREISAREHNLRTLEFDFERKISELQDNLVDAEQALQDAWVNVNPEKLATKSAEKEYANQYVHMIENAEAEVERIKLTISKLEENHSEEVKLVQDEITTLKNRISKLHSL